MDVLRVNAHENPLAGDELHGMQIAGGQDCLELEAGRIYTYIGIYPLIANVSDNALHKVWKPIFGASCEKPYMLGAERDAGASAVLSPYLK